MHLRTRNHPARLRQLRGGRLPVRGALGAHVTDPRPSCRLCGAVMGDMDAHQVFHDSLGLLWQQAFSVDDETYERATGQPATERDARLAESAETHGLI